MEQAPRLSLGQLLVESRLISQENLDEALALQAQDGRRLGTILLEKNWITETELTQILSHHLSVPWVSLLHIEFSRQLLNLVPKHLAERYCLVPIYVRHLKAHGDTLYVAMEDPTNQEGISSCREYSGLHVRPMIAPPSDIRNAIRVYYGVRSEEPRPSYVSTLPPSNLPRKKPSLSPHSAPSVHAVSLPDPESLSPTLTSGWQEPVAEPVLPPPSIPAPKEPGPEMLTLTLLDGTEVRLPRAQKSKTTETTTGLTAHDLVTALRASQQLPNTQEILGKHSTENILAALISILLKKHLIADWEFVEELNKMG